MKISNYFVHKSEEKAISGRNGSGLLFFPGCNMRCCFCKDYRFSILEDGVESTPSELAGILLGFQKKGCHNVNLCNIAQHMDGITEALAIAREGGFSLPVVYNSNGYDEIRFLEQYASLFQIYLADLKFSSDEWAVKFADAPSYVERCIDAVSFMAKRLGQNVYEDSVLRSGILLRHLILPGLEGNEEGVREIARTHFPQYPILFMTQFVPAFEAYRLRSE